jgi:hypothetical protein
MDRGYGGAASATLATRRRRSGGDKRRRGAPPPTRAHFYDLHRLPAMSGSFSSADASAPPPLYDATYDDLQALLNEIPYLATHPLFFDAPPASSGGAELYAYNSQAQVAADPRQDLYLSSANMHGQPAAATLRDGVVFCPERRPPPPGANAAVPSTSAWSTPELTASTDVTSRSVTPASTFSSPLDGCGTWTVRLTLACSY